MSNKWSANILSRYFAERAESSTPTDAERKILRAARPVARFFENIGFVKSDLENTPAYLRVANGRINLDVQATSSPFAAKGQYDGIKITLGLSSSVEDDITSATIIYVSLNEKGEGHYARVGNKKSISSGDPRKVVTAFIDSLEKPIKDILMPYINRTYGKDGMESFKPMFG